jgi:hypothetical protein
MAKLKFEHDVRCTACGGTGLYRGMAERDGATVVCYRCEGTGKEHIVHEYEPFNGRKLDPTIKRVYQTAGGYCITDKDVTHAGQVIHFSKAGISYQEWMDGGKPLPIRELHCPVIHFGQGTPIGEWFKHHHDHETFKSDLHECEMCFSPCSEKHREQYWAFYDQHEAKFLKLKE